MFRPLGLMHIIAINIDQFCSHYFLYHVEVKIIRELLLFIPDSNLWNGNSHLVEKSGNTKFRLNIMLMLSTQC